MNRLTKRHSNGIVGISQFRYYNYDDFQKMARKLADYEDLEEQGLLLKLPCKVGDTVYIIKNHDKKIVKDRVIDYDIYSIKEGLHLRLKVENNNDYIIGKFNNDIFLTIEEAEEKLKIMLGE